MEKLTIEEMVQEIRGSRKNFCITIRKANITAANTDCEMIPLFGWHWDDEFFTIKGNTLKEVLQRCLEML